MWGFRKPNENRQFTKCLLVATQRLLMLGRGGGTGSGYLCYRGEGGAAEHGAFNFVSRLFFHPA